MAAINTGKLIVGGLVSGIVLFVGDIVFNTVFAKDDWQAIVTRLNLDQAAMESTSGMISWIVCDLLFGIVTIWIYAGIRPRFGPGPMTAAKAGLAMWATMALMFYGLSSMGIFPLAYFVKSMGIYLVVMVAAALAGGYFYKEV